MFWKFHLDTSGIDTLLSKQDVTLKEILDEEDVLQECKTQNEKLIDFLTQDDTIKELLHLVVDPPDDDVEETLKYKHKNLACEVITLDIDAILEKIAGNTEHFDILWSFTDTPPPLNPLIASFFSKVITILVCRKANDAIEYLKSHDAVNKLIVHIEISAIMELFIKMVSIVESQETRIEISKWLDEQELINKLIQCLHPSEQEEIHYNASQLLSELARIGRDSISQYVELEDDPLLLTIEKKESIEKLVDIIFEEPGQLNSDSSVVHGISTLSSLLEIKRPVIEGIEELITPMDVERIAQGIQTTLDVLATRLQDFHDMLLRPHSNTPMETTYGILDPPLGKVRLSIAALISTAITTNTRSLNDALAKTGTLGILMDLFARYEWNNFLHSYVLQCILAILSSETNNEPESENPTETQDENSTNEDPDPLIRYLFKECNVIQRCMAMWEDNEISEKGGNHRKGFMGHLTRIINEIISSKEKGPNQEIINSMFNELSDEVRTQWNDLVTGPLEEINKKNLCAPVTTFASAFDSDSDDEYRQISMTQYEGTLQQAFENYQVQPMTNEFIETFGYDEDSLQQSENVKNPFDDVGNIDFSINANEESENEKLFENICEQKIQPFEDSDESEEEDIWEEKELTYTADTSLTRQRKTSIGSDSSDSSDEEKPTNKSTDSVEQANADPFQTQSNNHEEEEKMEVDAEWTANFDNMNTDSNDSSSAASWAEVASSNTTNLAALSSSGEAFADFTDLSKFESDGSDVHVNSPMAVDADTSKTPTSSVYEVKMEEDNPTNPAIENPGPTTLSTTTENVDVTSSESSPIVTSTASSSMVGGYVVVDLHHDTCGSQQMLSSTSTSGVETTSTTSSGNKLTTITVKSVRTETNPRTGSVDAPPETPDTQSKPSEVSEPPETLIIPTEPTESPPNDGESVKQTADDVIITEKTRQEDTNTTAETTTSSQQQQQQTTVVNEPNDKQQNDVLKEKLALSKDANAIVQEKCVASQEVTSQDVGVKNQRPPSKQLPVQSQ